MVETWSRMGKEVENTSRAKWEKGLTSIGFRVERIDSYPVGLDSVRQQIPSQMRPMENSGLTERQVLGEALLAEFDGYKLVMVPPQGSSGNFPVNVYSPEGALLMSNHDYSPPEFFDALRRNIPSLKDKIPNNAKAYLQDLLSV